MEDTVAILYGMPKDEFHAVRQNMLVATEEIAGPVPKPKLSTQKKFVPTRLLSWLKVDEIARIHDLNVILNHWLLNTDTVFKN